MSEDEIDREFIAHLESLSLREQRMLDGVELAGIKIERRDHDVAMEAMGSVRKEEDESHKQEEGQ